MSDITPADALRELGDDQAEYAAAAAKKLGLPESVEYVEMRTEYGIKEDDRVDFYPGKDREQVAYWQDQRWQHGYDAHLVVREVITTAWREVTP